MFSSKKAPANPKPAKPPSGRERLHHIESELAKANTAVADLEKKVSTLEGIGVDAIAAEVALQSFIQQEGGIEALAAHSEGNTSDDDQISILILAEKKTSQAAGPAKAALPLARDTLDRARAEVVRLGEERHKEIERCMTLLADVNARKYKAAFDECCRLHDELTGFANATSTFMGEVVMIVEPLKIPRFNLPSLACLNDHDPFLRRQGNSYTVNQSTEVWNSVKQRLEADSDSDLTDLIGPT